MLTPKQMKRFRRHLCELESLIRKHQMRGGLEYGDEAVKIDVAYKRMREKFLVWVKSTFCEIPDLTTRKAWLEGNWESPWLGLDRVKGGTIEKGKGPVINQPTTNNQPTNKPTNKKEEPDA